MTFTDDQIEELIAEAQQATFCRCYHESQGQDCGIHGDAHARLVGGLADALAQVKAERDEADAGYAAVVERLEGAVAESTALRVEAVTTGQPPVQLLACTSCGVIVWDIDAHYDHAHGGGYDGL